MSPSAGSIHRLFLAQKLYKFALLLILAVFFTFFVVWNDLSALSSRRFLVVDAVPVADSTSLPAAAAAKRPDADADAKIESENHRISGPVEELWNFNTRIQLDKVLSDEVHSVLVSRPFWKIPLLPLDTVIIDNILGIGRNCGDEVRLKSSEYQLNFAVLYSQWEQLKTIISIDWHLGSDTVPSCHVEELNGTTVIAFRCNNRVTISFSQLHNDSNYYYIRGPDRRKGLAFKIDVLNTYAVTPYVSILLPQDLRKFRRQLSHGRFIECDRRTADEYQRLYGDAFAQNRSLPESSVRQLAELTGVLQSLRMTPFLCGGTLLGWRRECGIIPYTSDFDLCVPISQYNDGVESILANHKRFHLRYRFGKPSDSLEFTVYDMNGIRMDIFFLYEDGRNSWLGGMGPGLMKLKYTYPLVNELCAVDLLGELFHVPCNYDEFILADYGTNWMKPVHQKSYVWYYSSNSVSRLGHWPAAEAKEVEKVYF